jgi:ribosome maturation factor RimP
VGALEEVRDLAESVARRRHLRLWDVEVGGRAGRTLVRVFVDRDGGVDLDTVAEVSEEISRALDLVDPFPASYTLEVSSPGLERNLKRPQHFELSVGRKVIVKTKARLAGETHRVDGVIVDADDDGVGLSGVSADGGVVRLDYDAIKSARTVFEWS